MHLAGVSVRRVEDITEAPWGTRVSSGTDGYRVFLCVADGQKEGKRGWSSCLRQLKERGLKGVQLVISDVCLGLKESAVDLLPPRRTRNAVWCISTASSSVMCPKPRSKHAQGHPPPRRACRRRRARPRT